MLILLPMVQFHKQKKEGAMIEESDFKRNNSMHWLDGDGRLLIQQTRP